MRTRVNIAISILTLFVGIMHAVSSVHHDKFLSDSTRRSGSTTAHEITRLHFQHYSVEDGLSQGTISTILQDHYGFMWFGTYDGLNRFDGITFTVYRHRPNDSTSLWDNRI